jgi:hypothetical protein
VALPAGAPLACLPLQIGTTSVWSAGRAAAALFPGLALIAAAIWMLVHITSNDIRVIGVAGAVGVLLVLYALGHLLGALQNRASDVLLHTDGLLVDGGRLHGERIAWTELTAPYAGIEEAEVRRITMWSILLVVLSIITESLPGGVTSKVRVWRLHVHRNGKKTLIAETDRPIERDSMAAAASSVGAVVTGQRYVAEAPTVRAAILTCRGCGAPAVPDDAPQVTCAFCNVPVDVPSDIRGQAAAAKAMSASRGTTAGIIAKLREQPKAARTNAVMLLVAAVMFGAWPIGWGLTAASVLEDGFQPSDLFCLLSPFAAVLAGFFLARARLADRGALQLLTLGFGALSPARPGLPSRCRRCQGPLPDAGLGGVTQCRYCSAENIVGLDLRPSVDPARTEQATFDAALQARAKEKRLWTTYTAVAAVILVAWIAGTVVYVARLETKKPTTHAAPAPHSKPASRHPH